MQIAWEAESGLAEIDERIADADRNISQISTLIPELEVKGYSTTNLERDLALMRKALHHLRAQRRTIVETLDEDEPLPRIARTAGHSRNHRHDLAAATTVARAEQVSAWRGFYARLLAS
jgi:ribosomal protein L29